MPRKSHIIPLYNHDTGFQLLDLLPILFFLGIIAYIIAFILNYYSVNGINFKTSAFFWKKKKNNN